jgi:regulator of ribonuclease activity A
VTLATADLCDAHPHVQVAEPLFSDYGGDRIFHGMVVAIKVFEDNALVRTVLEEAGKERVLVVDGGGSLRCALVGGNMAALAVQNGWRGIIVNGCIRDCEEVRELAIGVKALGLHPRRSEKGLHLGQRNHPVMFGGVRFRDGQWLYADSDGIVVSDIPLHGAIAAGA